MKRSEMIEYIRGELLDLHESLIFSNDGVGPVNQQLYIGYMLEYQSEALLAMIEGFGMLPPEWTHLSSKIRTWEEEDD